MADVVMPQLGETVTEGTITKWLKSVGDQVAQDEALFEVSTDKVDSEVPSSATGFLQEILVQEGDTVDVGTRLAVIGDSAPSAKPSESVLEESAPVAEVPTEAKPASGMTEEVSKVESAVNGSQSLPETSQRASSSKSPGVAGPPGFEGSSSQRAGGGPALLSPVVRRLIDESGIDPASIRGTGLGGRITRDDAEAAIGKRNGVPSSVKIPGEPSPQSPAPASLPSASPATTGDLAAPRQGGANATILPTQPSRQAEQISLLRTGDEVIPFTNIRRRTAEHMLRSKQISAHTLVVTEVDFEGVDAVRRNQGENFMAEEGFTLTYLPFVMKSVVEALRAWPNINASVGDDSLIVHHDLHIGVAVDLNSEGLIVPVVRYADTKSLRGLGREIRDLADRARSKQLLADEVAGGTFTITNAGPFGTFITAPIINQPQVAILSTDGVARRPVVVQLPDGTEGLAIHSVGHLALSFDHRVIDGAYAARFLQTLKETIETRDWSQEL